MRLELWLVKHLALGEQVSHAVLQYHIIISNLDHVLRFNTMDL